MGAFRPTRVDVDLDAIRHNIRTLKPPSAELMAVVKANAYGHGDAPVVRAALEAGATWLGVAMVEEGLALRDAGIDAPILVLSEFPAGSEIDALGARLIPTLYTESGLERLVSAARGTAIPVHVKVDTGMHRVGVHPPKVAPGFLQRVVQAGLVLDGVWTHFARSEEDEVTTKEQLGRFMAAVDAARAAGLRPRLLHAANSGATILHPDAHLDLVRPGISIYGIEPAPGVGADLRPPLRPALRWRSSVAMAKRLAAGERVSYGHRYELARDAWIATVPVGYADGYARALSGADVLLGGRRCPVAGSVTMDQLMVDCGDVEPVPGQEVVLLGAQGTETIGAWELAMRADTLAYEIVTRIGERVPREHRG